MLLSYSFCWVCLRTEVEHNGNWKCEAVSAPVFGSSTELTQIRYLNLWDSGNEAVENAKSKQRVLEQNIIPKLVENCGLTEQDVKAVREAGMLIVQCRQVLKWCYVFDYFMTEYQIAKKQHLNHQRDAAIAMLCKHEGTLRGLIERAFRGECFPCIEDVIWILRKLETSTRFTGNYFQGFVKNLEDGMPEVKDENGLKSRWFCDRCKFENILVDKECQRCFLPLNTPPSVVSDINNNSASV